MPGIAGIITKRPREWAEPQVARMMKALRHESFYRTDTWNDESLGVYAGWTAIDGSFGDGMPLERGDRTLLFSGEDYSGPTGSAEQASSRCACYLMERAGAEPDFPASLDGLYHGLLVDRSTRSVRLFNDRYGMHRLYYHESPDAFYFAPEAKAILAARPDLREASLDGLGEYLAYSCVLENRTIFRRLRPAGGIFLEFSEWLH